jgi:5-methylcytosine-specific restriction endonuclease McrA
MPRFALCNGCGKMVAPEQLNRSASGRCRDCAPAYIKRKNARQEKARGLISKEQRHRVMVRDGYRCVDCGATTNLAVDHLVPVVETGPRRCTDDELCVLCKPCNGRRGGALSRGGRGYAAS